jgi:thiamine pyrophosphokinase
LVEYAGFIDIMMVTDAGIFFPILESTRIETEKGQQVSVFSIDPLTEISSTGLKYKLDHKKLTNWWTATLNEAEETSFTLEFNNGRVIVYLKFQEA